MRHSEDLCRAVWTAQSLDEATASLCRSTSPRSLSRSPSHSPARRLDETDEAQLERLYKPVFVLKPSSCKCSEGQTARFNLKVVGRPMPETYWFHNGEFHRLIFTLAGSSR